MQKVKLNIVPKGVKRATYLSQNDNGRVVRYELFNELVPYTLDGSETITLTVVRPDGEEIVSNVPNTEEAYIDVTFNDDMSAIAGVGAGEIKITDGETVLGSHNFDINVEIDAYNGKDVVIETETGTLLSFNTEVEDNALEYESEIPYNAEGYTGLRVINSRTAPVYNKTPYLFRKTPDGSGNSCIEKLTGLSVAFNQLVQNGNFESASGWSSGNTNIGTISVNNNILTMSLIDTPPNNYQPFLRRDNISVFANRKYFVSFDINIPYATTIRIETQGGLGVGVSVTETNKFVNVSTIYTRSSDSINQVLNIYPQYASGVWSSGDSWQIKNVCFIDLTALFGSSTIADYIYSLEQATAGVGVSFFKSLGFNKPYYDYNAGSLLSSKPVSKKVVGFNLLPHNFEIGKRWEGDGSYSTQSDKNAANPDKIRCLPNTTYCFYMKNYSKTSFLYISEFDGNKSHIQKSISNTVNATTHIVTFTTGSNTYYMSFSLYSNADFTASELSEINVNYSGSRDGEYEPYSEETYDFTGSRKVWRRYVLVDIGALNWGYQSDNLRFYTQGLNGLIKPIPNDSTVLNALLAGYVSTTYSDLTNNKPDMSIAMYKTGQYFYVINKAYTDAAAFKTAMSGKYLLYEVETPYEETVTDPELRGLFKLDRNNNIYADGDIFTDFDNPQEVKVTEEFIDGRSVEIPVGHDTIYGTDIEYLDIDFDTTIYGGEINAVDGVLSSEYNSDGSVKPTPEIIDITPTPIPVRAGDNKIFNSANGNQTIRYYNQVE